MRLLLLAFSVGILAITRAFNLALVVSCLLVLLALLCLAVIFVLSSQLPFVVAHRPRLALWLAIGAAFCGGALFHAQTALNQLSRHLASSLEGVPLLVEGRVLSLPTVAGSAYRFEFYVGATCLLSNADAENGVEEVRSRSDSRCSSSKGFTGKILLNYYLPSTVAENGESSRREATPLWYPENLRPGTNLQVTVKLNRPHGFSNPGGFDYEAFLFRQKILAKGYVRGELKAISGAEAVNVFSSPLILIERLRFEIRRRLLESSESSKNTGIVLALGLGDSSLVSQLLWNQLRATGTTHLLVVSGLHIGMIAVFLLLISRQLWRFGVFCLPAIAARGPNSVEFSLWFSLIGTGGFALLTGWSLPTQRAVVMLAVFVAAKLASRRFGVVTGLLFALTFVLVHSPLAATGSGFWLSFVAVSVLVLSTTSPRQAPLDGKADEVPPLNWLSIQARRLAVPQIVVTLAIILPLLLFGVSVSVLAPLINLLAIPFLTLALLPASLLAVLDVSLLGQNSLGAFALADFFCAQLVQLLTLAAELNLLWEPETDLSVAYYLVSFVCLCACLIPIGWYARFVCGMWVLVFVFVSFTSFPGSRFLGASNDAPPSLRLDLLDVGQGLALLIRTRDHALLYDTGASLGADFEMGNVVIRPALRALGINQLDRLVISHADNDHAGGAASVLRSLSVADIHVGGYAESYRGYLGAGSMGLRSCRRGDSWRWDGVAFSYLSPMPSAKTASDPSIRQSRNAQSCVLKITLGDSAILLTGDIERAGEASLALRYAEELKSTILLAPHHGSKTSSTFALLKRAEPKVVMISAGYKNSFGHPHAEVLSRYALLGVNVFNTAATGMLSVELNEQGMVFQPRAYRVTNRRYWRPIP